jgi:hypothetical protein
VFAAYDSTPMISISSFVPAPMPMRFSDGQSDLEVLPREFLVHDAQLGMLQRLLRGCDI